MGQKSEDGAEPDLLLNRFPLLSPDEASNLGARPHQLATIT
jgi:hypothetical protein